MASNLERGAGPAAVGGGILWAFALSGFTFGELEYQDPTRTSPVSEWLAALALGLGAALIVVAILSLRGKFAGANRSLGKAASSVALAGAAVSLVPFWPMIFFGPLLVSLGLMAAGIASIRSGVVRGGWSWTFALGIVPAMAAGAIIDVGGGEGTYGGFVWAAVLGGGLIALGATLTTRPDLAPAAIELTQ